MTAETSKINAWEIKGTKKGGNRCLLRLTRLFNVCLGAMEKNMRYIGIRTTEAALRIMAWTEYQNRNRNDILVSINFQCRPNEQKHRTEKLHMVLWILWQMSAKTNALIFETKLWFKFCCKLFAFYVCVQRTTHFFLVHIYVRCVCFIIIYFCHSYWRPVHLSRFCRRTSNYSSLLLKIDTKNEHHIHWASRTLDLVSTINIRINTISSTLNVLTVCLSVCLSVNNDKFFGQVFKENCNLSFFAGNARAESEE